MRLSTKFAVLLAFTPLVASAQYKDLDTAVSNLTRGFGSGDPQAIVAGVATGDQVLLQFPGLVDQNGATAYGRDQAAYMLDALFSKVRPTGFDQKGTRGGASTGQFSVTGSWTIQNGGKSEARELYLTLQKKNDRWSLASVRSAGK
jgi:hypothetical protein